MQSLTALTRLLALGLLALLASCASLNEDECITANWQTIGYEDGASGLPDTRIKAHREACAKHGISPNLADYRKGHQQGLTAYCTAASGFNRARNGHEYQGVCPPSAEPDFLTGYQAGAKIYRAESHVSELEAQLSDNAAEQQQLAEQLQHAETELFARHTSEAQQRAIYQETSQLKQRQGALAQERDELIRELAHAQAWLDELRSHHHAY
jgi:hypothetical protein